MTMKTNLETVLEAIANQNEDEFYGDHSAATQAAESDVIDLVDISRYNGTITAFNPQTGNHRTFKVSTVKNGGLQGKRIISLLTGSDNENDYQGFGFVREDGGINVWSRLRGTQFDKLARFLEHADHHAATNGVQFKHSILCRRCNRKLTDPVSIETGMGPHCREME